jgi:mRNA-degrading endonuclease toxin of MazEF toxin-antitoxin module
MPASQKKASHSTTSWTKPEAGDVIHYRYIWRHEAEDGSEEGRKTRPCLVLATSDTAKGRVVHVAPITTQHFAEANSVAMPLRVAQHLRLDAKSTIITSEYNSFVWTGPDVFPKADGTVSYGKAPERLYEDVRSKALANRAKQIVRTQ